MFVTWRLHGTLPVFGNYTDDARAFAQRDLRLDRAATGPQWLRTPKIAQCVVTNLLDGIAGRYEFHAFVCS